MSGIQIVMMTVTTAIFYGASTHMPGPGLQSGCEVLISYPYNNTAKDSVNFSMSHFYSVGEMGSKQIYQVPKPVFY